MTLPGTALILASSGALNSMGRTLPMAELLDQVVERTVVYAPEDGPLWGPSVNWNEEIRRARDPGAAFNDLPPDEVRWIVISKPLRTGLRAAITLKKRFPQAKLLLDMDDDDEAFSHEFLAENPLNLGRLLLSPPRRQLLPRTIRHSRRAALELVDGVSVGTFTVATEIAKREAMTQLHRHLIRIPQPRSSCRNVRSNDRRSSSSRVVGFFGTIRPHKGMDELAALMDSCPDITLHAYESSNLGELNRHRDRMVTHPPDESWSRLYESVDVVVLPQRRTPGADVQLPAKLMDAINHGAPTLATRTPAIEEVAGDTLFYIERWTDVAEVSLAIDRCIADRGKRAHRAKELFDSTLSIEANAPLVEQFLLDL